MEIKRLLVQQIKLNNEKNKSCKAHRLERYFRVERYLRVGIRAAFISLNYRSMNVFLIISYSNF